MNATHCEHPDCDSWVHGDPPTAFAWGVNCDGEPVCPPHIP